MTNYIFIQVIQNNSQQKQLPQQNSPFPTCYGCQNRYSNITTCNNCNYLQDCIKQGSYNSQFNHGG